MSVVGGGTECILNINFIKLVLLNILMGFIGRWKVVLRIILVVHLDVLVLLSLTKLLNRLEWFSLSNFIIVSDWLTWLIFTLNAHTRRLNLVSLLAMEVIFHKLHWFTTFHFLNSFEGIVSELIGSFSYLLFGIETSLVQVDENIELFWKSVMGFNTLIWHLHFDLRVTQVVIIYIVSLLY